MAIDWESIFRSALGAATDAVTANAPQLEDFLREIAKGHEAALMEIGEAFAVGDIDEATFKSELDDEARTLQAELRAVAVLSKAIAQRAINAFRDALFAGVKAAIAVVI
ncbi:MAG: hypothetical protein ABL900_04325 [Burkholderiaceae bacterium]